MHCSSCSLLHAMKCFLCDLACSLQTAALDTSVRSAPQCVTAPAESAVRMDSVELVVLTVGQGATASLVTVD